MYMHSRFDLVFSYWIFLWFLLYHNKAVRYNPKFALVLGLFTNMISIFLMIYYKNSLIYILLYLIIQLCIKILPLWTLRHTTISKKDIIITLLFFIIFNLWVAINDTNYIALNETALKAIKHNEIGTPIIYWIDKWFTLPK